MVDLQPGADELQAEILRALTKHFGKANIGSVVFDGLLSGGDEGQPGTWALIPD